MIGIHLAKGGKRRQDEKTQHGAKSKFKYLTKRHDTKHNLQTYHHFIRVRV